MVRLKVDMAERRNTKTRMDPNVVARKKIVNSSALSAWLFVGTGPAPDEDEDNVCVKLEDEDENKLEEEEEG